MIRIKLSIQILYNKPILLKAFITLSIWVPINLKQADQFMLDHTDYTILIYDDEQEASPKYFKAMLVEFMEKQTILVIL